MKTRLSISVIAILAFTFSSYGQFSFGVSPGIGFNSAYFGYKVSPKLVPYVGFQYLNAKFSYEQTGERFDWDQNAMVSYTDDSEFSGSLFIPNIGVKYFFIQKNKVQTYFSINASKPIISGKAEYDGEVDDDLDDYMDNIKIWGGELGFGMEYFFDDNFSLGGEFGMRYLNLKYEDEHNRDVYNGNTGNYQTTKIKNSYKFNTSPTFSKISLNYYF